MTTNTDYSSRCDILAQVWKNEIDHEDFYDFAEYNDLGLPLAHAIYEGIVSSTPLAEELVNETFEGLLVMLKVPGDTGFKSLEELMSQG